MKKGIIKGLIISVATVAILTVSLTAVNAQSVYDEYSSSTLIEDVQEGYTLEEMLNYAILDEFMAKAEYEAIIETFGEVKPFTNIVSAEQTHIDLLLPLFEVYGYVVPENSAVDSVVIPDSITSALATGVEAEEVNILMYETFLAQDNLPDDVREAFEYLMNASKNHLNAFSKDKNNYLGEDIMNQFKNAFRNMKKLSKGNGQGQHNGNYDNLGSQAKGIEGNTSNCSN